MSVGMQMDATHESKAEDMIVRVALALAVLMWAGGAGAQSGDEAKGERAFNQLCKTCHTPEKGGKSSLGPNLSGLFGRKAGTTEGFKFSEAMTGSGIVWDEQMLMEYLQDPKGRIPGNKMVFVGVKRPDQLADLIAYLKKATQ